MLAELDILDKVIACAVTPPAIVLHEYHTGSMLSTPELERNTYGVPHLAMHRADLRKTPFDEAKNQGVRIRLGSAISFNDSELENGVVRLADGEVAGADLIMGADGANSKCRTDIRAFYARWEPTITALLESATGCLEWMISEPEELKSWVHSDSRLVLIGDAAHQITPYLLVDDSKLLT